MPAGFGSLQTTVLEECCAPNRKCTSPQNAANGNRCWWPTVANCPDYRSPCCRRSGPQGKLRESQCQTTTLDQWSHRPRSCRLPASQRNRDSCFEFQSTRAESSPGTEPGFRQSGIPTGTFHRRIGEIGRATGSRQGPCGPEERSSYYTC